MPILKFLFSLMFTVLLSDPLFGKISQPPDTIKASEYLRKGDLLVSARMFDSSKFYFERALSEYGKANDVRKSVVCYNKLAEVSFNLSNYDQTIFLAREALNLRTRKQLSRNLDEAESYNILGLAHSFKSNMDSALNYFQKALDVSVAILGPNHRNVAKIYARMGGVMVRKTENGTAIEYFEKALQIFLKSKIKNDPDVAEQYNGIGRAYGFLFQNEEALRYLNLALDIYRSGLGENSDKVASCYNNIGLTHFNMGNYTSALDYFHKSLSIYKTAYHGQHPFMLMVYRNIGNVHHDLGKYDSARESFLMAVSIGKRLLGEVHPAVASCYGDLMSLDITIGDLEKALQYNQESLIANGIQIKDQDIRRNPSMKGFMDIELLTRTMRNRGLILYTMYTETGDLETLRYSLNAYRLCDSLLNVVRKSFRNRADKISFGNLFESLFENAIEGYWVVNQVENNNAYIDSAFYYSERSRAAILSEALTEVNARTMSDIPTELIELERNLREEQGRYSSILQMEKSKGKEVSDATDKLFHTNRKYDSLLQVFEKRYPKFYQNKYNDKLASIKDIQASLDKETAWIQYFVSGKSAFVFTFTNDNLSWIKLNNIDSLGTMVKNFRAILDPNNNKTESFDQFRKYIKLGHGLYKLVLQKALMNVSNRKKLIIVPDGALGYIPFDVLLTSAGDSSRVDYKELPYLLNKYRIHYGYSATLLLNRPVANHVKTEFIGFAPVYDNSAKIPGKLTDLNVRSKLTGLSWNQHEVRGISSYMNGTAFVGDQALEGIFKSQAEEYGVIHLAMHAIVDDNRPMFSKLAFTISNDSIEDGFLNAYELYGMNISAQMVVLSACETGYGKMEKGEGIMSLAHGFTYAGCPSVVMSHWVSDDQATAQLMELFYQYINKGMQKDEALQRAKIDFIKRADDIRQNPAFWGGFVVLGDAKPLIMKSFFERYWIELTVLLSALLVLSFFLLRSRRASHKRLKE